MYFSALCWLDPGFNHQRPVSDQAARPRNPREPSVATARFAEAGTTFGALTSTPRRPMKCATSSPNPAYERLLQQLPEQRQIDRFEQSSEQFRVARSSKQWNRVQQGDSVIPAAAAPLYSVVNDHHAPGERNSPWHPGTRLLEPVVDEVTVWVMGDLPPFPPGRAPPARLVRDDLHAVRGT
jgi:hypothetical protein